MVYSNESLCLEPCITVPTVAELIARVFKKKQEKLGSSFQSATEEGIRPSIESQRRCLRGLKREFSLLSHKRDLIAAYLIEATNGDLLTCLNDVASKIEKIIAGDYVHQFIDPDNTVPEQLGILQSLYLVVQTQPSNIEDDRLIRDDVAEHLEQLLYAMQELADLIEDAVPLAFELEDGKQTFSESHEWTPFNDRTASPCVQPLAERLHRSLHFDWPCHREEHEQHSGTLGECTHAYMRLDPQWIINGVEGGAFFVVLSVDDQYQECKVHLKTASKKKIGSEFICLLPYEDVRYLCLCLEVDATDRLLWDDDTDPMEPQMFESIHDLSVSYRLLTIRQLLECIKLSPWAKRYIQIILARSILPLLQGNWVESSLTINDVSILCAMNDAGPCPLFDKLFVSTKFGGLPNAPKRLPCHHPIPVIQALGILIAAIELGEELEVISREQKLDSKVSKRNGDVLFSECSKRSLDTAGVLHTIRFCIDFRSFTAYRKLLRDGLPQHDPEFAKHYYNNIIRPLEKDLVDGCRWSWEQASWRKPRHIEKGVVRVIGKGPSTSSRPHQDGSVFVERKHGLNSIIKEVLWTDLASKSQASPSCKGPGANSDAQAGIASEVGAIDTEVWFKRLSNCHTTLHKDVKLPLKLKKLVKVAILDTGVDLDHPAFSGLAGGQIDRGLDLINKGSPMTDLDGHGTHICHTLLKTAPYAKVYPIRVFRGKEPDKSSALLVAKAIKHAICEWDVDIISMSLGFDQEYEAIQDAMELRNKSRKRVLIFAAACNNRALEDQPICYPARKTGQVICVFSSRTNGRRSDFSPHGRQHQPNISVVGEDVLAAWPPAHYKTMSGTSCATPIVAGIAALLLEFATKELDVAPRILANWESMKGKLKESSHMQVVLKECMSDWRNMDGTYNFLKPWKLFEQDDDFIVTDVIRALKLDA